MAFVPETSELVDVMVEKAKAGDTSAAEWIYRNYIGLVRRICLQITHNRESAQDLAQDVFLKVLARGKIRLFKRKRDATFKTWLWPSGYLSSTAVHTKTGVQANGTTQHKPSRF
jgi:hypothetical protein